MAGRRKRRMITVYGADGANLGSVVAIAGDEQRHVPEGGAWKDGHQDGRVNPATGRRVKLMAFPVKRGPNCLTGVPDDATVIVNDRRRTPENGVVRLDVDWDEPVYVQLSHPLYEYTELTLPCTPAANSGGDPVEQDHARLRIVGYADVGSVTDQLDDLWKLVRGMASLLSDEQRASLDPGALATMDSLAAVKARVPKKDAA